MNSGVSRHHYNLGLAFREVVARFPDAVALKYEDCNLTFGELDRAADGLAVDMLARGISEGEVIAIGNEKKSVSFALMLAALRLGVAYVNIDVLSPADRNSRILETSAPRLIYYDTPEATDSMRQLAQRQDCAAVLMDIGDIADASHEQSAEIRAHTALIDGATIAYLMFTSGSTGVPKGVAVTHQNVLHFISWGVERFSSGPGTVFANLSPMYFDNSVFDFYVGLFSGAALAPVPRALLQEPYALVDSVQQRGATIWFSVPSLLIYLNTMKAFAPGKLPDLRFISFGGEGYPKPELRKLFDRFSGQAKLVNVYGPTECTCICSAHDVSEADFADMSGFATLGSLNPNFDHLLVDEDDIPCDEGELLLIGPNVAAGYYNDPERTKAAFGTFETPTRYMKRYYRTGDILRRTGEGLSFVGRKDNQIKHMGYRIELEEIEHALGRQSQVNQAAAIYLRTNIAFGKIVAFVSTSSDVDEASILKTARDVLPEYMVPSQVHILDNLPKNANGKVDKQALKALLSA